MRIPFKQVAYATIFAAAAFGTSGRVAADEAPATDSKNFLPVYTAKDLEACLNAATPINVGTHFTRLDSFDFDIENDESSSPLQCGQRMTGKNADWNEFSAKDGWDVSKLSIEGCFWTLKDESLDVEISGNATITFADITGEPGYDYVIDFDAANKIISGKIVTKNTENPINNPYVPDNYVQMLNRTRDVCFSKKF